MQREVSKGDKLLKRMQERADSGRTVVLEPSEAKLLLEIIRKGADEREDAVTAMKFVRRFAQDSLESLERHREKAIQAVSAADAAPQLPAYQRSRWSVTQEEIATFGFGTKAPNYFWGSEQGKAEAKRRLGNYISEHGHMVPAEDLSKLGLVGFYRYNVRAMNKTWSAVLEEIGIVDWSEAKQEVIAQYGLGVRTPKGFWQSEAGAKEIRRRIDGYKEREGRLPSGNAINNLGLGSVIAYFNIRGLGIGAALSELGYGGTDPGGHVQPRRNGDVAAEQGQDVSGYGRGLSRYGSHKTYSGFDVQEVHRYGRGLRAPNGFWTTEEGRNEAKRRIDKFREEYGVLPLTSDVHTIGLFAFYSSNREVPWKVMLAQMGYSKDQISKSYYNNTSVPLPAAKKDEEVNGGISAELREGVRRAHAVARQASGTSLNGHTGVNALPDYAPEIIARFGVHMQAPLGFWSTKAGRHEAQRRLLGFIKDQHRPPTEAEFDVGIGLAGYSRAQKGRTSGDYNELLRQLGIEVTPAQAREKSASAV